MNNSVLGIQQRHTTPPHYCYSDIIVQRTRISRIQSPPTPTPVGSLLSKPILNIVFEMSLIVVVPTRESRSVLGDVSDGPSYPELVEVLYQKNESVAILAFHSHGATYGVHVIIGADDVKVAPGHSV